MKKIRWTRTLLRVFLAILILIPLVYVGLHFWIRYNITPESLALHLEREKNLRAQIDGIRVDLLQHPAVLEIRGLKLAPRDEFANADTPLKDRPPLTDAQTVLSMEKGVVRIALPALLTKELDLRHMLATNVVVNGRIDMAGVNNVEEIFRNRPKPKKPSAPEEPKKPKKKSRKAVVYTNIALGGIDGGRIDFLLERDQKLIRFEPEKIRIDGVVDPSDLAHTNTLHTAFQGTLTIVDMEKNQEFAKLNLLGNGEAHPYDMETKELDPSFDFALRMSAGSTVSRIPLSEALKDKPRDLKKLRDLGLDTDRIVAGGSLRDDTDVVLSQEHRRLFLRADFLMVFDNFGLGLEKDDFIDLKAREMKLRPHFVATARQSDELVAMVQGKLAQKAGDDIASLLPLVLEPLRDENNRISFSLKLKGDMKHPDITLNSALGDIGGTVGSLVKGFFQKDKEKEKKGKGKKKPHPSSPAAENPTVEPGAPGPPQAARP